MKSSTAWCLVLVLPVCACGDSGRATASESVGTTVTTPTSTPTGGMTGDTGTSVTTGASATGGSDSATGGTSEPTSTGTSVTTVMSDATTGFKFDMGGETGTTATPETTGIDLGPQTVAGLVLQASEALLGGEAAHGFAAGAHLRGGAVIGGAGVLEGPAQIIGAAADGVVVFGQHPRRALGERAGDEAHGLEDTGVGLAAGFELLHGIVCASPPSGRSHGRWPLWSRRRRARSCGQARGAGAGEHCTYFRRQPPVLPQ